MLSRSPAGWPIAPSIPRLVVTRPGIALGERLPGDRPQTLYLLDVEQLPHDGTAALAESRWVQAGE
jgi:hypothetical protein